MMGILGFVCYNVRGFLIWYYDVVTCSRGTDKFELSASMGANGFEG